MMVCLALMLAGTMAPSVARADDDEPEIYDARVQGFDKNVQLSSSSTALIWLLMIILGGITVGVMFMNARRSHLD